MIEIKITSQEANQRVDKYVRKYLNNAPLSFIYRLFRKKDIKIDGHWVDISYILKADDLLRIYITDEQIIELSKPREIKQTMIVDAIIFEDENIMIVSKSKGLLVHGDEKEKTHTLANQVINYLIQKGEYNPKETKGFAPAPAHRLDRNTSGLIVFAKNLVALQELEAMFKSRKGIEKHYLALVVGRVLNNQTINLPLKKDASANMVRVDKVESGALDAKTKIEIVKHIGGHTLLDVELQTGRTHQIRVHLAAIHHPVVGDGKYGDFQDNRYFKERFNYDSQFLHAYKLSFSIQSGLLSYLDGRQFTSQLPKKEDEILEHLRTKENNK
ncbi:MAG: RluA family pseudouridine synthase [Bacilli bacterium]|nr:RluA family pseudouridine synthase [Bacilli bacterium]